MRRGTEHTRTFSTLSVGSGPALEDEEICDLWIVGIELSHASLDCAVFSEKESL